MDLPQHPDVAQDVAQIDRSDPSLGLRLARLMAFVEHIEKLSRRPEYRQLWPDRVPDVGEESFAGEAFGTIGPVTIYTWEREEFVLSLEERQTRRGELSFRWLACVPMGSPDAVIALARRRAETH